MWVSCAAEFAAEDGNGRESIRSLRNSAGALGQAWEEEQNFF